jgi:nicotinate-nucleotide--dimethylbenzimidazole phosphoribosyltransferase
MLSSDLSSVNDRAISVAMLKAQGKAMRAGFEPLWKPPLVQSFDRGLESVVRGCIDGKAKPPGSLGRLEELAVQLGMMWHPLSPRAGRAVLLIFAGDHGLTAEGVSQYPAEVTSAMVRTFLAGRACANAVAAAAQVDIQIVDAGVAGALPIHPKLLAAKLGAGTRNAAREPAMSPEQASAALSRGCEIAVSAIGNGADIVAIGEMGIGNTASSALITHRLAPAPLEQCIGNGAGQDEQGLERKRAALVQAARRTDASSPFEVLVEFGGFEIAMMAGAIIGSASQKRPVLVDGFIASAAALVAIRMSPAARDYCVFAHRSAERGHGILLDALNANPLLDLGLRLGEGTGSVLAVPLVRAAARLLTDVASLSDVLSGAV